MKLFIVLYVLLGSAYCAPMLDEQLNNQWGSFKEMFKKQYGSMDEEMTRRMIWETNLVKIEQHNLEAAMNVHTYTLGMNQFGDMTHEEFQKQLNTFKIPVENNSDRHHQALSAPSDFTVPRAVDWRSVGAVTPVKDQGKCNASWAFAAAGTLEGQHFTEMQELVALSVQNLIDCSTNFGNTGCQGGVIDFAIQYVKVNGGIDTEKSYPYQGIDSQCRFNRSNIGANTTGFRDIDSQDENALIYAIAIRGPIAVTIDASHSSFQFYKSGVYDESNCSSTVLNHCALAVGFNATDTQLYYTVKNSWGTTWGIDGYIWMSRKKDNQCGIATRASYSRNF